MTTGDNTDGRPPTLQARGVVKTFPGVRALDGVDLTLRAGRLNALMGENGAGKSTLMKVLAGVHALDAGEVLLEGRPVAFRSTREAQLAGVAIIHQELSLTPNLSIAENLFLGREPVGRFGLLDKARMRRETAHWLRQMAVDVDPDTPVGRLTVATQQVVEIAKALSLNARVLILDEPTSALTAQETERLFERIAQLKADGVALAYITHRFEELGPIADEVTVFRDGRLIGERPYEGLSRDELVRMMIGRSVAEGHDHAPPPGGEPVMRVRKLRVKAAKKQRRDIIRGVDFEVRRGEVLGLFGLVGAGRTELLEALFGLYPGQTSGVVTLGGEPIRPQTPGEALEAGVGLVPEDRKHGGLVFGRSIEENMSLSSLGRFSRWGWLDRAAERRLAGRYFERIGVKAPSLATQVENLSGGNQQKVVLAKILATDPRVLLLDEPTRGIDVGAKHEVYSLIRELASEGRGVLFVSSEAPELIAQCDRILVMCEGQLTAEFARGDADEHRLVEAAFPKASTGIAA